jgi:hypothetical protein
VPGVVYDPAKPEYAPYIRGGINEYYLTTRPDRCPGVVGLWIANSRAIEDVTDRDGITVVLEDDFVCTARFFERARDMVSKFDRPFDIVMFDCLGKPRERHRIAKDVYRTDGETFPRYHGSHALFVNNRSIPKILEAKAKFNVMDIDGFFLAPWTGLEVFQFYTREASTLYFGSRISHIATTRFRNLRATLAWHFWTRGFKRRRSPAVPGTRGPSELSSS